MLVKHDYFGIGTFCLPSHEHSPEGVGDVLTPHPPEDDQGIEQSELSSEPLVAVFVLVGVRRRFPPVQAAFLGLVEGARLFDIVVGMGVTVMQFVGMDGVWHSTPLWRGSGRVDDIVGAPLFRERGVVLVGMVVLVRDVERGVRIGMDARHGRAVVLARNVGHGGDGAQWHDGNSCGELKTDVELVRTQTVLWRIYSPWWRARDCPLEPGPTVVRPGRYSTIRAALPPMPASCLSWRARRAQPVIGPPVIAASAGLVVLHHLWVRDAPPRAACIDGPATLTAPLSRSRRAFACQPRPYWRSV
jgi:hypothetical protein